jgi:uncharacterized membrane protein
MDTRVRKIAVAGVLGAISVLLGVTHWGFIPWVTGAALTIMHVPVIIGAVLEGPVVGLAIGFIFGLFSLIQGAVAPTGPTDTLFVNPMVSILPRLFIGPVAWWVFRALRSVHEIGAMAVAGLAGSLTNTLLVLTMISIFGGISWAVLGPVLVANGVPEAVASAVLTVLVVAAWKRIAVGREQGSSV